MHTHSDVPGANDGSRDPSVASAPDPAQDPAAEFLRLDQLAPALAACRDEGVGDRTRTCVTTVLRRAREAGVPIERALGALFLAEEALAHETRGSSTLEEEHPSAERRRLILRVALAAYFGA